MPRTSVAKCQTTAAQMAVLFTFTDGETVRVEATNLPDEIRHEAELAGLAYTLRNAYSGEVSPEKAREKLSDRLATLAEGKWTSRKAGEKSVSAIAHDYSVLMGVDLATAAEAVKDLSKDAKAQFRRDSKTAFAIARIKDYEPADSMKRLLARSEEERVALHGHKSVQAEIAAEEARQKAEKAKAARADAKGVSLDDI